MKKKVSLVLSGGGARGSAHIGVIEELERQGYLITSIAGTSMGALVGGVYALGKMPEFKEWICSLDKIKVFKLIDFTFSTQGLVKGDKVLNAMKAIISDTNIEDLKIPYAAIATDILNKKEVVFREGSIYKAIRASISIPTVFTPLKVGETLLVDGGIINNIPLKHVKRSPGDLLIAVNVNADIPVYRPDFTQKEETAIQSLYRKRLKRFHNYLQKDAEEKEVDHLSYFNLIDKTLSLMMYQISQLSIEHYAPDLLIKVSRDSCSTFDFFKAEELVEIGRHAAAKSLAEMNLKIND
ncbi:MAG: patatin-like phospholipase family protein [Bacteroidales bacterium]|jgi:NTE family protein|nr:patatin-like phospholipase family protein [Bacteroidales bacterium]